MLPPLVEEATAQTPPRDCDKCIVIEYEGWHAAVISGIESFANTTTQQEQYNWYLWKFVNSLVSDGFEIKAVTMDDIKYEEDDNSTEHMYRVVLVCPKKKRRDVKRKEKAGKGEEAAKKDILTTALVALVDRLPGTIIMNLPHRQLSWVLR